MDTGIDLRGREMLMAEQLAQRVDRLACILLQKGLTRCKGACMTSNTICIYEVL
jgi:hypothetical protein